MSKIFTIDGNRLLIKLPEKFILSENGKYLKEISKLVSKNKITEIEVDYSDLKNYDTLILIFEDRLNTLAKDKSIKLDKSSMPGEMIDFISKMEVKNRDTSLLQKIGKFKQYIINLGSEFINLLTDIYRLIEFFGLMFLKFFNVIFRPDLIRWKDFPLHFTRSGVNAVPIVVLIVFLLGLITGYQGAMQLARFGADIYIADLIGISLTRELSPLMVAIIVAGRSGSAFAAEIGTMKISEEIDALETMGFDIANFLLTPRILSVTIAMPLLVIICDLAGVVGGLIAAISTLDISITAYINQMQRSLSYWDIGSGLIKSVVFGYLIAAMGCFRGLQVTSGADSVGKYTTSSVVSSVFLIIFVDAIFVFIFQALGI